VLRRADESASAPRRGLRDLDYLANLLAAGDSEVVRGVLRRLADDARPHA
jgi:nitrate reductase beta subunit